MSNSEPQTTPRIRLNPVTRKRTKTPDPAVIARLLEKVASEYPDNVGRHNLLMQAATLIRMAYPNRTAL